MESNKADRSADPAHGPRYFLYVVWRGVSPKLLGPFNTTEERGAEALRQYLGELDQRDSIFWLDVASDGGVETGAYPQSFFEDGEVAVEEPQE